MSTEKCPICDWTVEDKGTSGGQHQYLCKRCGRYRISPIVKMMLKDTCTHDETQRAVLSHAVRKMQAGTEWPMLTQAYYQRVLQQFTLPKPAEQAQNLLLWLGQAVKASDATATVGCEALQAIIGAQRPESVYYVADYFVDQGIITHNKMHKSFGYETPPLTLGMKFEGWERYEQLKNESGDSRTAFMAMQFGDSELTTIVEEVFRPAVAATGFDLRILTDVPRAGLIDDRLRVEIRRSRFVIADITHRNPGAYWEAGFAEGLGKPVI